MFGPRLAPFRLIAKVALGFSPQFRTAFPVSRSEAQMGVSPFARSLGLRSDWHSATPTGRSQRIREGPFTSLRTMANDPRPRFAATNLLACPFRAVGDAYSG